MHQQAAHGVVAHTPLGVTSGVGLAKHSDGLGAVALPGELGRVVQHQHRRVAGGGNALARGTEMPGQNVGFADAFVAQEAVGRLDVGPVLADQRDALARRLGELPQQCAQPPAQAGVPEDVVVHLLADPALALDFSTLTSSYRGRCSHASLRLSSNFTTSR